MRQAQRDEFLGTWRYEVQGKGKINSVGQGRQCSDVIEIKKGENAQ